ncbi:MAG TPA: nucleotide-binding protein [Gammaproteobacteria bacterium]|nr:nucleotide-binding protein [Gammaproteobacteria bacterium]
MPSFDIVAEVDNHELTNAVDQMNREVSNRFDFKGSDAKIILKEYEMNFEAASDFQLKQMRDIMVNKLSKRGIDKEDAKKITKMIKEKKFKVQAAIQGEQVRVTGKKRDELQEVMAYLKAADIDLPLQFNNFRD